MSATDATLNNIAEQTRATAVAIMQLYDAIREAKDNNYSYNELERATGMPRGTLQNIAAGRNPRFSLE